ncbi:MBG domain-containing protein [Pedobacter nutrimenti]|uniref:Gliding motility-associated-like protein n=1 Tax=Pedobacter nutrimenti TaxID=1241337 RepID=A0A318UIN3_9SPHI|nr:MBG domain-containing protein [Pedobacter nutrimenti]PYF74928.1 gliding motility-associated-like protein [Pedobacter nutrimenti]
MKKLLLLIAGFLFLTLNLQAQIQLATSQTNGLNGACLLCGVTNPNNAVNNSNLTDYSSFAITEGLIGVSVEQTLIFPVANLHRGVDSLMIRIGADNAVLTPGLFGGVSVETANGTTSNNDAVVLGPANVRLVSNGAQAEVFMVPGAQFDRVKIKLSSILVGQLSGLRIYYTYYTPPQPQPDANGILYVKKGVNGLGNSWSSPLGEVADALKLAKNNTAVKQIWVAAGNYKPLYAADDLNNGPNSTNRQNSFVLVKDVAVYGGFAGTETQLGQRNWALNKTILSGEMQNDGNSTNNAYHVVISAADVGSATLDGFTVSDGVAFMEDSGLSRVTVNATLLTNRFAGGIYCAASSPLIKNCLLTNHTGYASTAFRSESGSPVLVNTVMSGNSSTLYSVVFTALGGPASLINVSIVNNSCTFPVLMEGGVLYNSIVWGNTVFSNNPASSTTTIQNSIVQKGSFGSVDIGTDPLMNNVAGGDYSLKRGSPAINGGNNTFYPVGLNTDRDLAANPRLIGNSIDIGAYEYQSVVQSISPVAALSKTYGDADFNPGATSSSGLTVSYSSADNSIAEAYQDAADGNKWKIKIKKVGVVSLKASQAGAGNVDPAPDVTFTLTVAQKPVTVVLNGGYTKLYDGKLTAALTAAAVSFTAGDVLGGDDLAIGLSAGGAYTDKNAGHSKALTLPLAAIALSGVSAPNYRIANSADLGNTLGQIDPVALTITANNAAKTYDGQPYQGGNGLSYNGFVNAEDASVLTGTLMYTGNSQGAVNTGSYTLMPSGLAALNYTLTYVSGTLTISSSAANILTFNTQSPGSTLMKTYGDADVNASAVASSGLAASYQSSNPLVATINAQGQVQLLASGTATITAAQAGDSNYAPAAPLSFIVQIAPKALQVTAKDYSKTYDGLPYQGGNGVTYAGFVNGDTQAVLSGNLVYNGTAQGAVNTGNYSIVPSGLTAANYQLSYVAGNLNIVPAGYNVITFNAQTAGSTLVLTYGDAAVNASALASSGLPVSYNSSNPAVASLDANGQLSILSAGNTTITASQPGDGNHLAAVPVSFNLQVQQKGLVITANNLSKTYDHIAFNGGGGLTYTGFVKGENESKLQGTLVYGGTAQGAIGTGSYFISPSGLTSSNYDISYKDGSLTITKAGLTVNAVAKSKVYGSADPLWTYSVTGLLQGDALQGTLSRSPGENTGSYPILQGSLSGGDNYSLSYVPAALTISKAALVVTADNQQVCQGANLPVFSLSYSGFQNGDNANSLGTKASVGTAASAGSPAGSYALVPGGAVSANYTFSYVNGNLQINALPAVSISSSNGNSVSKGESLVLTASGGNSYLWEGPGIGGQNTASLSLRPQQSGTYTVTVSNASGCSQRKSFDLTVREDFQAIATTNIISPNGDGINDLWIVKNIDMYPNNQVKIFDRAGRIVYEKRGYDNSWNGTVNGSPLSEGTYYYILDFGTGKLKQKGYITVIRQ